MLIQEFNPEATFKPDFLYVEMITLAMYYLHVINPFILCAMSNDIHDSRALFETMFTLRSLRFQLGRSPFEGDSTSSY